MIPVNHAHSDRRLRVVHVTHGLEMGGLEKLLVEFARHADRERFDLHFVSLGGRGLLADEIEACDWPVTALETPVGLRPGLALRLARKLTQWHADVLHTHDERPLLYGALAARLAGTPATVHTRHGRGLSISRRQMILLKLAAQAIDRYVCVSEDSARLTHQQGVAADKVCTIRNGIDTRRFNATGPRERGPAVLVARLSPEKDIATLLRATALAIREAPSFRLEIAGDGACLPNLKQQAAALGITDSVQFIGQVRHVPAVLERAGLFVLSSLSEGISLTLLEAMACALPVVATRVGGNPEVVVDGETGLLAPAQDPPALAAAMLRLWQQPNEARRLGQAGRRRVEQFFDVRRMVAEYESLYETLSDRPSSRRFEMKAGSGDAPAALMTSGSFSERGVPSRP